MNRAWKSHKKTWGFLCILTQTPKLLLQTANVLSYGIA